MSHIDDLMQRYLDNTATEEERAELMKLIRSGETEADIKERIAENVRTEILMGEAPIAEQKAIGEVIFQRIMAEKAPEDAKNEMWIERDTNYHGPARGSFGGVFRYAAAVLLLCAAAVWMFIENNPSENIAFRNTPSDGFAKVVNTGTVARKLTLSDGSTITLEPGSEVRYAEQFNDKREVYLSGDAFFDVTKDPSRPFLVYTNEVTTRVLGTSFRIKAKRSEKEIVVAVKTGKVSVYATTCDVKEKEQVKEVTLTPNLQAIYKRNENIVVRKVVDEPQIISAQPELKNYYVNAQIVLILKALSESYGVEIRYDEAALSGCTLTSDMIEGEGLYEQLEIICHALGGRYRMEDDASIVVEAGGCPKADVKP